MRGLAIALILLAIPAMAEPPGWAYCTDGAVSDTVTERCVAHLETLCKAAATQDVCVVEIAQTWMQFDANATLNYGLARQSVDDPSMTELAALIAKVRPDFSGCAPDDARCYLSTVVGQALSNLAERATE